MQILTLPSQYIFSLLIFVVKNRDLFLFNSEIHNINTHNNSDLHMPNTNLTIVQKGVLYSGSKIYNKLPPHVKGLLDDLKHFKSMLKSFFVEHTLYSIAVFCQVTWKWLWFLSSLLFNYTPFNICRLIFNSYRDKCYAYLCT